jgi:hypothetical protein
VSVYACVCGEQEGNGGESWIRAEGRRPNLMTP